MLKDPIPFSGSPLDRAGNPRRDPVWLQARRAAADSRFLLLRELKPLITLGEGGAASLCWFPQAAAAPVSDQPMVFLGLDGDVAHFAVDLDGIEGAEALADEQHKFIDVRSIAPQVSASEAAILAQARSMIDWHQRHGFCAKCGAKTQMQEAGYSRRCTAEACAAQHFPRTDPVVIMIAVHGENILLGRQKIFLPGMYSALAGFMEPGETIEEAVRRELNEEAGIRAGHVRYVASQPWPFPSSLMIGCVAETLDATITVDPHELEDARWFHRDEVAKMLAAAGNAEIMPRMPPALSLAHQITERYLRGG